MERKALHLQGKSRLQEVHALISFRPGQRLELLNDGGVGMAASGRWGRCGKEGGESLLPYWKAGAINIRHPILRTECLNLWFRGKGTKRGPKNGG